MGKMFCITHGPQHGPQCCSHVLAAIDASSEAQASVEPDGLVSLSLDLLDDRQRPSGALSIERRCERL